MNKVWIKKIDNGFILTEDDDMAGTRFMQEDEVHRIVSDIVGNISKGEAVTFYLHGLK